MVYALGGLCSAFQGDGGGEAVTCTGDDTGTEALEQFRGGDGGEAAGSWGEDEHEADHDAREVDGGAAVEDEEEGGVGEGPEAEDKAYRHQHDHDVDVLQQPDPPGSALLEQQGQSATSGVFAVHDAVLGRRPGSRCGARTCRRPCCGVNAANSTGERQTGHTRVQQRMALHRVGSVAARA